MENLWSDADARSVVEAHAARGIGEDLALRVYTTRLLGGEPRLVLHGGGNTSVKTTATDLTGETVDVICVKGSGSDMGVIEPPGLPAVRIEPLHRLRKLDRLSDEDMVNAQRAAKEELERQIQQKMADGDLEGAGRLQRKLDAQRTEWLEARGYRVLRFWNNEVIENADAVVVAIRRFLEGRA